MVLLCQTFSFAHSGFREQMWRGAAWGATEPWGPPLGNCRCEGEHHNLGHSGKWLVLSSDMLFHCAVTRGSWPQWVKRPRVLVGASDMMPPECRGCSMSYDTAGLEVIGGTAEALQNQQQGQRGGTGYTCSLKAYSERPWLIECPCWFWCNP